MHEQLKHKIHITFNKIVNTMYFSYTNSNKEYVEKLKHEFIFIFI